jgi:hypothetical protein
MFKVGQQCHYAVGSDVHAVVVEKVSAAKVVARRMVYDRESGAMVYDPEKGAKVAFSRRDSGKFMLVGYNFGVLHDGFKEHWDPCF